MSGSAAEERIRAAAEASLRRRFPDARIIHELVLEQMSIRIDLAAVTADQIVLGEIKSEKDVLKRLPAQLAWALRITPYVEVYAASKHSGALEAMHDRYARDPDTGRHKIAEVREVRGGGRCTIYEANPTHCPDLRHARVLIEQPDGGFQLLGYEPRQSSMRPRSSTDLFQILWADEMREQLGRIGGFSTGARATRDDMIHQACEHLTGRQIRRAVCRALRGRPFARADEAAA